MNEHSFVRSFHKRLDKSIKVWKIYDPYQGGVPDAMLFGNNGIACFVEYKYVKSLPKRETTKIKPALSAQQLAWLNDKIARGLLAVVILGSEDGVVIFRTPEEWGHGSTRRDAEILDPRTAAVEINQLLGVNKSANELEIQSLPRESSKRTRGTG